MKREDVLRVASVDNWYGILAVAIVVVGFSRAIAAKGWAYYEANGFFWAKIAAFVAVAPLSIIPTIQIIRWRLALPLRWPEAMPSRTDGRERCAAKIPSRPMSLVGHKRTFPNVWPMSALPPNVDLVRYRDVRYVPEADVTLVRSPRRPAIASYSISGMHGGFF